MQPLNKFVQVKERGDLRVASQFIETVNAPDVFTPDHCSVVEVVDSEVGFKKGDLVVVSAGSLSAFLVEGGQQLIVLPAHEIQARYDREGAVIPLGSRIVCEQDSATMQKIVLGEESRIILPETVLGGLSISGEKEPRANGRASDVQTGIYARVAARGPKAAPELTVGTMVAFSPTIDVAQLTVRNKTLYVVSSKDCFGYWPVR